MSPQRLDIAVKWRFFDSLWRDRDWRSSEARQIYRWHIQQRTGGIEPRSWKRSLDDYENSARDLLGQMTAHGFDPASPIVLGACRGLTNGAHRLACALFLELESVPYIVRDRPARAAPWDLKWMQRHGLSNDRLVRVFDDFSALYRGAQKT